MLRVSRPEEGMADGNPQRGEGRTTSVRRAQSTLRFGSQAQVEGWATLGTRPVQARPRLGEGPQHRGGMFVLCSTWHRHSGGSGGPAPACF